MHIMNEQTKLFLEILGTKAAAQDGEQGESQRGRTFELAEQAWLGL